MHTHSPTGREAPQPCAGGNSTAFPCTCSWGALHPEEDPGEGGQAVPRAALGTLQPRPTPSRQARAATHTPGRARGRERARGMRAHLSGGNAGSRNSDVGRGAEHAGGGQIPPGKPAHGTGVRERAAGQGGRGTVPSGAARMLGEPPGKTRPIVEEGHKGQVRGVRGSPQPSGAEETAARRGVSGVGEARGARAGREAQGAGGASPGTPGTRTCSSCCTCSPRSRRRRPTAPCWP